MFFTTSNRILILSVLLLLIASIIFISRKNPRLLNKATTNSNLSDSKAPPILNLKSPQSKSGFSQNDFIYPNSSVQKNTPDHLILKSQDNPDKITGWYKEKIESSVMKTTSFVVTKTSGNTLNKLVGSDGKTEVRVDITQNDGGKEVSIEVYLKIT